MLEKEFIKFPLILKTPVSKGSKDVFLIHSIKEYKKTINDFKASFPNTPILIEEYVDGPQYLIELVVAIPISRLSLSLNKKFLISQIALLLRAIRCLHS